MMTDNGQSMIALDGTVPCAPVAIGSEEGGGRHWAQMRAVGLSGALLITVARPARLSVFSADGRLVVARSLPAGESLVESALPHGVYIVELLAQDGRRATAKLAVR